MLVWIAQGDAYGAAFEFVEHKRWAPNTGDTYYKHPDLPLGNGRYTDDAQMSLAVIEAILHNPESDGKSLNYLHFAERFFLAFKRDVRPGYGSNFHRIMAQSEDYMEMMDKLISNTSTRSGAVMRAAPVGGYKSVDAVLRISALQASVTHNTPIAIECSQAISLAAHYLIHKVGNRDQLGHFLNYHIPDRTVDWSQDRTEWASVEAVDCARNAITAWRKSATATEVLVNSVAPGGDTDTVAAIAMALAWADSDIKDDLSLDLTDKLESGEFGFEFLFDISFKYVERFVK